MEIQKVSFNGWVWGGKKPIPKLIEKLPQEAASRANAIVNSLSHTTPHHNLWCNGRNIFAQGDGLGYTYIPASSNEIGKIGFLKTLERVQKFIAKENTNMPKREARFNFLNKRIKELTALDDGYKNGLVDAEENTAIFITRLVKEVENTAKGSHPNTQDVVKQLSEINKKATNKKLSILLDGQDIKVYRHGALVHNIESGSALEQLNGLESFVEHFSKQNPNVVSKDTSGAKKNIFARLVDKIRNKL